MVVKTSENLPEGTLLVVTQDCQHWTEPSTPHGIKVPEFQVSKSHASITYNKPKHKDKGSANGNVSQLEAMKRGRRRGVA